VTSTITLPPVHRERLPNELEVVVAERPGVPLAAARLVLRGGASLDPEGRHGLSHLAALAARRGTRRRTGAQIDLVVESLGAELGSGVDEDASYYGISAPVEGLGTCLDILADVASRPTFPAAEVARLRRREVAALAHDVDEPALIADRALLEYAYAGHPYGHAAEGRSRHLARATRADVLSYHTAGYLPAAALLVVVGRVRGAEVLELVRRRFGGWKASGAAPLPPSRPAPPETRVVVVDKPDVTQTQVRIASAGFPRKSPDYHAGVVASALLGGGFASRLMEAIRVNRGLSYSVRSRFLTSGVGGIFTISTFTKLETTAEIVKVALDEAARFADGGPTDEELDRTKSYLCGLYPLSLETHDQLAEKLADLALFGLSDEDVTRFPERIRAVDAAAAREAARRYFPLEQRLVVAVGPARRIAKALGAFGPVEVVPAGKVM
jgi:zinc protease